MVIDDSQVGYITGSDCIVSKAHSISEVGMGR